MIKQVAHEKKLLDRQKIALEKAFGYAVAEFDDDLPAHDSFAAPKTVGTSAVSEEGRRGIKRALQFNPVDYPPRPYTSRGKGPYPFHPYFNSPPYEHVTERVGPWGYEAESGVGWEGSEWDGEGSGVRSETRSRHAESRERDDDEEWRERKRMRRTGRLVRDVGEVPSCNQQNGGEVEDEYGEEPVRKRMRKDESRERDIGEGPSRYQRNERAGSKDDGDEGS